MIYYNGERALVELHIVLDEHLPLRVTHDICENLQDKINSLTFVERTFIHVSFWVKYLEFGLNIWNVGSNFIQKGLILMFLGFISKIDFKNPGTVNSFVTYDLNYKTFQFCPDFNNYSSIFVIKSSEPKNSDKLLLNPI